MLHDLSSETIVYIANAYSKRRAGDSSLNAPESAINLAENVIGPYYKTNWNGHQLKSISAVIRDQDEEAIGLLCINYDVAQAVGLLEQLQGFIDLPKQIEKPNYLFSKDWREGINQVVGDFLKERNLTLAGLTRTDVNALLLELDRHGVFEIRNAVPYVAELFQLTRATIYNRLGTIRKNNNNNFNIDED